MSVAVLGLGTMGGGMARRLLEKGFALGVWNRTPGAVAALTAAGATAHAHAGQAVASADIVLTMLPTADAVSEVMLRGGVLDAVRPGATWAQMGTIGIEATERLAAEVARRRPDVTFVDAPVSGSREPARTGRLVILASGPDRAQAILEPVFAALGQRTVWLGPAGRGSRMKLVLNTLLAFEIEAVAEVDALASKLGVPYADLVQIVAGGPLAENIFKCQLKPLDFADPAYGGMTFNTDQQLRLQTVFSSGVCDWTASSKRALPPSSSRCAKAWPTGCIKLSACRADIRNGSSRPCPRNRCPRLCS